MEAEPTNDNLMLDLETMFESKAWPTLPDPKVLSLNLAVKLTDKYEILNKKLEVFKFWLEAEKAKIEKQQEFIEKCCEGFLLNYMEQTGEKSLSLPNGHKLAFRKKPDSIVLTNEVVAAEWCKCNLTTAYKINPSVLKKPIMEHYKTTGELPPGIEFLEQKDLSFSIS